jgi:hypothetical protein
MRETREIILAGESRYSPETSCIKDITTVRRASAILKILVSGCETAVMRGGGRDVCAAKLTNLEHRTRPKPSRIEPKAEHRPRDAGITAQ